MGQLGGAESGDAQSNVDHVLRSHEVDNQVRDGSHGGDESVFDRGDDQGIQQALGFDKGRVLLIMRELTWMQGKQDSEKITNKTNSQW